MNKENQNDSGNQRIIVGRNPVTEAIKSEKEIEKLMIGKDTEGSIKKIIGMAKDKKISYQLVDKSVLDRISDGVNHQGVIAYVSEYEYCEIEDILQIAKERGEEPFVIILDGIEDPHNLGAIVRTAEGAGAHGIIVAKRRAVGITQTVAKASAGAVEYVPVARVSNIAQTVEKLKKLGLWIGACDMDGTVYYQGNLKGSIGLVIGAEGQGISRLVKEKCDFTISIPMSGKMNSLNASNAAAILMYEIRRQRDVK